MEAGGDDAQPPLGWDLTGPEGHLDLSGSTLGHHVFRFLVSNTLTCSSGSQGKHQALFQRRRASIHFLPFAYYSQKPWEGASVNTRCGLRDDKMQELNDMEHGLV